MSEGGELRGFTVVPISPDRYCPYCQRRLVEMNEDGTFNLAAKATIHVTTEMDPDNLPEDGEVEGFIEATCLLPGCVERAS